MSLRNSLSDMKNIQNSAEHSASVFHKVREILYGFVLFILLFIAGLVAVSAVNIPGNYKLLTVQSGSMEPTIHKGSIILIKPSEDYKINDVVTVREPANPKVSVTHRIVGIEETDGKTLYITKGDANNSADTEKKPKENILGNVLFSIPYFGYPVAFAKTQLGLVLLVIIPATLIIFSELMTIKNEAARLIRERKKRKLSMFEKAEVAVGEEVMEVEKEVGKVEQNIQKQMQKTVKKT